MKNLLRWCSGKLGCDFGLYSRNPAGKRLLLSRRLLFRFHVSLGESALALAINFVIRLSSILEPAFKAGTGWAPSRACSRLSSPGVGFFDLRAAFKGAIDFEACGLSRVCFSNS